MTATAPKPTMKSSLESPWEGFSGALWQREINVRAFIQLNYTPYEGDETFLARGDRPDEEDLGDADEALRRGAQEGRPRHLPDPELDHGARAGVHRQGQRGHRRAPDRGPAQARHHAERRVPHGAERPQDLRLRARSARGGGVHQVPKDPQRRGLRRLHRRHPALPELARPHRIAGRLRPRPDHRRLPARGALRRGPADRAQEAGEAGARPRAVHGRDHPRPRGAVGADPGARGTEEDGGELRVRHLGPGPHRARSRAVALLRLPGRGEGAERRGDVARPLLDLPRRLLRTGPQGGPADRGAGPGDHRRLRHQAPDRAIPPDPGVRRALRRRSHLGDGVHRRDGGRRPLAGHQDAASGCFRRSTTSGRRRSPT